jgi:TIR domain-containing protein
VSDVFISYSRKDLEFVRRLVMDLERKALSVYFDLEIQTGESFVESLSKAIESARYLLVVLSPDYLESKWGQEEMKLGLLRESERKATVIPLMVRECQPPPFLAAKAYANFTKSYDEGLAQLLHVLLEIEVSTAAELTEPAPGTLAREVDPAEIARLRLELKEAVAIFKANPPRPEAAPRPEQARAGGRKCFIVMPFGDAALQIVYEDFVRPIVEGQCALTCERGDDVFGSNVVMDDIRSSIQAADIVVADLTGKNANVFYEVGIAHTVGKPVLLMAQSIDDVPFDLRHRRVLLYEYSPRGCKKLEKTLKENLGAMIEKLA